VKLQHQPNYPAGPEPCQDKAEDNHLAIFRQHLQTIFRTGYSVPNGHDKTPGKLESRQPGSYCHGPMPGCRQYSKNARRDRIYPWSSESLTSGNWFRWLQPRHWLPMNQFEPGQLQPAHWQINYRSNTCVFVAGLDLFSKPSGKTQLPRQSVPTQLGHCQVRGDNPTCVYSRHRVFPIPPGLPRIAESAGR